MGGLRGLHCLGGLGRQRSLGRGLAPLLFELDQMGQLGVGFGKAVCGGRALARRGGAEVAQHGLAQAVRQVRAVAHGVHAGLMARGIALRFIDGVGALGCIAARGPAVVGNDQGQHHKAQDGQTDLQVTHGMKE